MASSSASSLAYSLGEYGGISSSQTSEAAAAAVVYSLTCNTGFQALGLQPGEAAWVPNTVICTLVTVSVTSAWISRPKSIAKLLLFFSHWLSGLVYQLVLMAQSTMISVCWVGANLAHVIKAFKFLELASANMLAITNLAICINLALVVMSHRTLSRVKSLSSPSVIFLSLVLSVGAASASVPYWETLVLTGTYVYPTNEDQRARNWISVSGFFFEYIVGVCMLVTVACLLLFRAKEVKQSWKVHTRIRYYFGLTLIGTTVNLAIGICGTMFLTVGQEHSYLIRLAWSARHIHIALDTIVLYGVLGAPARQMDERAVWTSPEPAVSGTESRNTSSRESSNGRGVHTTSSRLSRPTSRKHPGARQAGRNSTTPRPLHVIV